MILDTKLQANSPTQIKQGLDTTKNNIVCFLKWIEKNNTYQATKQS